MMIKTMECLSNEEMKISKDSWQSVVRKWGINRVLLGNERVLKSELAQVGKMSRSDEIWR